MKPPPGYASLLFPPLLFACLFAPGAGSAAEDGVLRLGVCLSLSGEYGEHGLIELAGAKIRVAELNAGDGGGRRVELVVKDTGSDPSLAALAVSELAQSGVRVIIGPAISDFIPAMREAAFRHDAVLISPSATLPGLGKRGDRIFSVMFGDDFQGKALAAFCLERMAFHRAAIIRNSASAYSGSIAAAFREAFVQGGGAIVAEETYATPTADAYDVDFTPLLERVGGAGPEVVLLPAYHDEIAAIVSQATRIGLRAHFCGGDSWDNASVFVASGTGIAGAFFVTVSNPGADNPLMARFRKLLDNSNDRYATESSVTGYDAVTVAVEASRGAGDTGEIVSRLHSFRDFPLATGAVTYDPDAGVLKRAYICEIVDTGRNVFASRAVARVNPVGEGETVGPIIPMED